MFRVNGPAGVAALGFGTESIPQVRKIVGPGSPPVACAQVEMQRYGVATMMILGPTESLVIADDSADPRFVAADLLNEAEHGIDSAVLLVTPSTQLRDAVERELQRQIADLPGAARRGCPRRARRQRRLRDRRRSRRGRSGRQSLGARASPGRGRSRRPRPNCSSCSSTPARSSSASTRCSPPATSSSAARPACRRAASPTSPAGSPPRRSSSAPPWLAPTPPRSQRMTPTIVAMSNHEGFVAHANAALIRRG